VARLGGQLVRPHDIALDRSRGRAELLDARVGASPGVVEAVVERVVRLGFEVRIDLRTDSGVRFAAQVTRAEADALGLEDGETVFARATRGPDPAEQHPALAI
jgi:sulfate transport system ATP-binding protein